ncbi:gp037 [Rhodococcus phage ReqiPoco6]|uniref:Gp037 n=1 Tax=Rhodococcus phage ReqiPoco6 TaxID=691964 RepID=D4P7Q5_9CAUD|nr:gp037 [Rhodococcus phage ReqiPoco6]ADD81035.1 gp037 [Rhodococcus phage ReqiPoco6]
MKFDKVILAGATPITLFDHKNPRSTPYTTRTIDGLGPTEVNVALAQNLEGGGLYIGRRPQLREITVNASLNPDYTIGQTPEKLREDIYRLVPVNRDRSLDFCLLLNGEELAITPVYVKRVDVSPFSKDTLFQIVLASTSEYFAKRVPILNEAPDFNLLNPNFVNVGSAPSGFRVRVRFTGAATQFGFYRFNLPDRMLVTYNFQANDILEINTNQGSRGVWLTRGGVVSSLIGSLSTDSTWLTMESGDNPLVTYVGIGTPQFTWQQFEYRPKYLGV